MGKCNNYFGTGANTETLIQYCRDNGIRWHYLNDVNKPLKHSSICSLINKSGVSLKNIWNDGEGPNSRRREYTGRAIRPYQIPLSQQNPKDSDFEEDELELEQNSELTSERNLLKLLEFGGMIKNIKKGYEKAKKIKKSNEKNYEKGLKMKKQAEQGYEKGLKMKKEVEQIIKMKEEEEKTNFGKPKRKNGAREIYNKHGKKAVGKSRRFLQPDGKYKTKYLRLRKNGSPYWRPKKKKNLHPKKKKGGPKKGVNYSKKYVKTTKYKKTKNGKRLSARDIYNKHGKDSVGKSRRILQPDGKYKIKYLRLRKNGSPYWSTKFGKNCNIHATTEFGTNCFG